MVELRHMLPMIFSMGDSIWKYLKVFRAIIITNIVDMMNLFLRLKISSKHFFRYNTMFVNITTKIGKWMVWLKNINIPFFVNSSIFPTPSRMSPQCLAYLFFMFFGKMFSPPIAQMTFGETISIFWFGMAFFKRCKSRFFKTLCSNMPWNMAFFKRSFVWLHYSFCSFIPRNLAFSKSSPRECSILPISTSHILIIHANGREVKCL